MKLPGVFTGDRAIEFWTGVYMSVTGSAVQPPSVSPTQPSDPKSEALIEVEQVEIEVETAA